MTRAELEAVMRRQVQQIAKAARPGPLSQRDAEQFAAVLVSHAEAYAATQRREAVAEAAGGSAP